MIEIHRLGARIGAEIRGVDVKALDDAGFAAIYRAWLDCNVVVVPGQDLQIEDFLRYSRRFGVVHPHPSKMTRHPDHPEITLLGVDKFRPDGALDMAVYRRGAEGWHTDGAYDQEPFKATQLYALAVPSTGGDTLFASMYAAYDTLSDTMKRFLEPLSAMHEGEHVYRGRYGAKEDDQRQYPKAEHPVIRTHPVSGRKALFVNRGFTTRIVQLKKTESAAVLELLYRHVETPELHCRFRWQPRSVAFWDNRGVQHHAMWDYFPQRRHGHRVTIKGDKPFYRP
jgi:taurine dioxygenase